MVDKGEVMKQKSHSFSALLLVSAGLIATGVVLPDAPPAFKIERYTPPTGCGGCHEGVTTIKTEVFYRHKKEIM